MADAIFDLEKSLQRIGGDPSLFGELVQIFLEDLPPLLKKIEDGLARADGRAVEYAAHALKGLAANFTALAMVRSASEVEELAHHGKMDQAAKAAGLLESEAAALRTALRAYQETAR